MKNCYIYFIHFLTQKLSHVSQNYSIKIAKFLSLCSTETESYGFGTTWGWLKHEIILILDELTPYVAFVLSVCPNCSSKVEVITGTTKISCVFKVGNTVAVSRWEFLNRIQELLNSADSSEEDKKPVHPKNYIYDNNYNHNILKITVECNYNDNDRKLYHWDRLHNS